MGSPPFVAKSWISLPEAGSTDGYILDFLCLRQRLIVEVDGGQHNEDAHATRDKARDRHFESQGFKILRFWNNEIDKNLNGALELIDYELRVNAPTRLAAFTARHPPPQAGEG